MNELTKLGGQLPPGLARKMDHRGICRRFSKKRVRAQVIPAAEVKPRFPGKCHIDQRKWLGRWLGPETMDVPHPDEMDLPGEERKRTGGLPDEMGATSGIHKKYFVVIMRVRLP